jgi:uncharacterized protein
MSQLGLPSWDEAQEVLRRVSLPDHIIDHVSEVARQADYFANKVRRVPVNQDLVEIGALFHDIGRSRVHGFEHGIEGGKIVRELGYPEELARIAERHLLGGLTPKEAEELGLPAGDYIPDTTEEKIVCLADKMVNGIHKVTVNKRFERWFAKYGRTPLLITAQKRVKEIEREIRALF